MDSKNAIELRDVSLTYTVEVEDTEKKGLFKKSKSRMENHILDRLNLDVRKGEVLGIIGTNGAGKSTLLSIMARILEPDSGTVEIDGKVATILELGMGFHQDLSGRENIILKGELYGFSKKQMESKTEEIIDYSGIRRYIDNPVRTYSSGMRSRLAFSIMIHVDAEIMLVDEILSTGDAAFSAKASDFFKKILKDGKTVVYVSHSPGSIESICTRVIWLDKGKIIEDGKPRKVCAQYYEASRESPDVVFDQAKSGMADAQYRLALFYKEGLFVEQNEDSYRYWLELAAEQGHIKAQVEMGDLLVRSGSQKDSELALSYYQSSAARGDSTARLRLSSILGKDGMAKGRSNLDIIFRYMAERGNPADMFRYANFLLKTALDDKDREESFCWFKRTAEEFNHPDAIIQTAVMYRDGIGVKKNKGQYLEMLEKGNSLGVVKAINMLADIYAAGIIVEEDQRKALELYEQCAEKGLVSCQYTVAMMYQDGRGTDPDPEKVRYWLDVYSRSQLTQYQLSAIPILKQNSIPGSVGIQDLYSSL
jgi:ABC-2 type transport system ATP-binding protein